MKKSLILTALLGMTAAYMSDPADSASAATPVPADAPAPVAVTIADVPVAHVDLLERVGELLKKDIGWLKDNIEAGIAHFEGMFKDDTPAA